ncbi:MULTISPECIES: gluconate 5-dehydrogenase [Enterobacterales]|jgi:gluconate 5-dehydrogenase|uniref:gluconate 5-dehydrogenase n=1 Tax=Enterobacterales TaxID=91347 RepID=UPI00077BB497|nr:MULTISPECIES: gluconate 5-dehydrogenase [Enterobacterales]MDY0925855.1 gluconate 5-dehydrogenase [Enterobacter sp. CFBP8995]MRS19862.1 gluconate 5-dehydrogenase [Enterobacteriaceae bacterium RIT692]MRT24770.1 gluconate 5-dehydrogenase [Enterobacteriaceae bacterium RIT697]MBB3306310.1 gluconate 5-dehydrogenase [Enterobacter sp. Sphag1F]NYI15125.1 gluconate 5-dehydrogenase [Enterobacter sp. Sphag71]
MSQLFSLEGKRVLLTGSARGIGFLLARGLAEAGAEVIVNATTHEGAEKAATQLRELGFRAHAKAFDVTQSAQVKQAVDEIEAEWGAIDVLVNNAGIQRRRPFLEFPEQDWNDVIAVNQTAVFLVSQTVAKKMVERQQGKIINIGSMQSELGRDTITPYAASKGAVTMLTRGMCVELARHNIQVNAIAPGYFVTEMTQALADDPAFTGWLTKRTPAARWGKPEELIGAAVFLASGASNFVNGHLLFVDGGMRVAV